MEFKWEKGGITIILVYVDTQQRKEGGKKEGKNETMHVKTLSSKTHLKMLAFKIIYFVYLWNFIFLMNTYYLKNRMRKKFLKKNVKNNWVFPRNLWFSLPLKSSYVFICSKKKNSCTCNNYLLFSFLFLNHLAMQL